MKRGAIFVIVVVLVLVVGSGCLEEDIDLSLCENKTSDWERDSCIYDIAEFTKNHAYCNEIGESIRCYRSRCWTIKDSCFRTVAKATGNPIICDFIKEVRMKDVCYEERAYERRDSSLCKRMVNTSRDSCYFNLAASIDNPDLCAFIQNERERSRCYPNIEMQKALVECKNMTEGVEKSRCFLEVQGTYDSKTTENAPSMAPQVTSNGGVENAYEAHQRLLQDYMRAVAEKNLRGCEEIQAQEHWEQMYGYGGSCLYELAVSLKNSSICERIAEEERRGACLSFVAREILNESSLCDRIEHPGRNFSCRRHFAGIEGNVSVCEYYANPYQRRECYFEVVRLAGDMVNCTYLPAGEPRDTCYAVIANLAGNRLTSMNPAIEQLPVLPDDMQANAMTDVMTRLSTSPSIYSGSFRKYDATSYSDWGSSGASVSRNITDYTLCFNCEGETTFSGRRLDSLSNGLGESTEFFNETHKPWLLGATNPDKKLKEEFSARIRDYGRLIVERWGVFPQYGDCFQFKTGYYYDEKMVLCFNEENMLTYAKWGLINQSGGTRTEYHGLRIMRHPLGSSYE